MPRSRWSPTTTAGAVAWPASPRCSRGGLASVPEMLAVMGDNLGKVQRVLAQLTQSLPRDHATCPIGSDRALDFALVTAVNQRGADLLREHES